MNKCKKSQVLMLVLLAAFLFITPFLSSSFRTTYLYFFINLLIFVLGAEAGLLSSFSKPPDHAKKPSVTTNINAPKPVVLPSKGLYQQEAVPSDGAEKKVKIMGKSVSEKSNIDAVKVDKVKKCSSMPSIFFIEGDETKPAEEHAEEEEEEVDEAEKISGQELFNKAEMFIGNFYKQLEMQREESWKKIHGVYQKAF